MSNNDVPIPGSSLVFFFFITLGFTIFTLISIQNAKTIEAIEKAKDGSLLTIIYIIIVIIGSYFINTSVSKALCQSQSIRWNSILVATLLPWITIFFTLFAVLKIFPGWISPFSNTVGYLVISILGVETTLTNILNIDYKGDSVDLPKAIANITHNKSNFINQINVDRTDFNSFIKELINVGIIKLPSNQPVVSTGGGLGPVAGPVAVAQPQATAGALDGPASTNENNSNIQELYRLLVIKNVIGKITWYVLAGVLVSSVSYNYIINMSCEKSLEEIQKDLDNAEAVGVEYNANN
jgi:hypothetical protein